MNTGPIAERARQILIDMAGPGLAAEALKDGGERFVRISAATAISAMVAITTESRPEGLAREAFDYRGNLARALFEASYGKTLIFWSDETRDFWLARADAALITPPQRSSKEPISRTWEGGLSPWLQPRLQTDAPASGEVERLRKALIQCGRNAGALLADDVSTDFLMLIPGEVRAKLASTPSEGARDSALEEAAKSVVQNAARSFQSRGKVRYIEDDSGELMMLVPHEDWHALEAALRTAKPEQAGAGEKRSLQQQYWDATSHLDEPAAPQGQNSGQAPAR